MKRQRSRNSTHKTEVGNCVSALKLVRISGNARRPLLVTHSTKRFISLSP